MMVVACLQDENTRYVDIGPVNKVRHRRVSGCLGSPGQPALLTCFKNDSCTEQGP